jgi:sec-independent protein translocase protein TatB
VEREIGADEIRRQLHNERILEMERELSQSVLPPTPGSSAASKSAADASTAPDKSTPP